MSRLKLKQIQELLIGTLSNGDFLAYNSSNGKWENNAAPIDGAKGATGPQGDKGEVGAKGSTGDEGDKGVQGPKGEVGATGDAGDKGPKGQKGE